MKRVFRKLFSKVTLIVIACILLLLTFFYWGWVEEQFRHAKGMYFIHKGDQAYSQDNMNKTLEYYKKGLNLYPEHYEAWFNLGNIYAVYEDYYSAVDSYQHAIEHNPSYVMARMNLGIVYSEDLGYFDKAIEQFEAVPDIKLLKLWIPFVYSNVKSIRGNRGLAYYNMGVAYKQKAMYLPMEKRYLANAYLLEAINSYESALKFIKKNYDIYYNKAVAHHLRGDYRDAGKEYCRAIKLKPMRYEAHYNLAVLLRQINRNADSINELQKAAILILEDPDSSSLESSYVFNILTDTSRRFVTSSDYNTQKLAVSPLDDVKFNYINGKMVPDEKFDKTILKRFKSCAGFEYFYEVEDED